MKFYRTIAAIVIGGTVTFTIPLLAQAPITLIAQVLSPEQINSRAKQMTVRIDGANVGSGVIIQEENNIYTVLTNWHVMQNVGDYVLQTVDGREHQVDRASIRQIGGLDLATFQFNSNQNYQLAEIGTSSQLVEGQSVYYAGYPGELKQEDNRYYRFIPTNIVSILPTTANKGYSLVYDGEAFPGMSGGPVLNNRGMLIGIHGAANINAVTGGTSIYAIPIDTYQQAIAKVPSKPTSPPPQPVTQKPATTNQPTTQPVTQKPTTPDKPATQPPEIVVDEPSGESSEQKPQAPTTSKISTVPILETPNANNAASTVNNAKIPEINVNPPQPSSELILVSNKTGIDYSSLKNLLAQGKWEEADRETYNLVTQIIKTAKNQNSHIFIELKSIAEFSCTDIGTIDRLWRKYSNDKFGFTPQQQIWQTTHQNGDFSTNTWRRFVTEVGWKQGDIASSSGYLLYEELKFSPQQSPLGHLPWWLPMSEEQQNVIKMLFSRCDFNAIESEKPKVGEANSPSGAKLETDPEKPNVRR